MGDVSLVTPLFLSSSQLKTSGIWQVWQFQDQDVLEFEKVHCHVWWRSERAKSLECVRCDFDEAKFILVETQHGCIENQCLNHQNKSCITKRRPAAAAPMKQRAAASPLKPPSCPRARKRRSHGVAYSPCARAKERYDTHPIPPHPTPPQHRARRRSDRGWHHVCKCKRRSHTRSIAYSPRARAIPPRNTRCEQTVWATSESFSEPQVKPLPV